MQLEKTELRREIGRLLDLKDFDGIGELPEIEIVERRDWKADTKIKFGCVRWLFNGDEDEVRRWTTDPDSPEGYVEVVDPEDGDLITYFFHHPMKGLYPDPKPTHSGRYVGNGRVRSKFRESHIYEHNVGAVPLGYGHEAKFFRRQTEA